MISVNRRRLYGQVFNEVRCLSTDDKPTDVKNGSICIEIDTGDRYAFDKGGGTWHKLPASGGGTGPLTPEDYEAIARLINNPEIVSADAPTAITLEDNTEYHLTNVSDLTITYPSGAFDCWLSISTASGTVTVSLPSSSYIGDPPTFGPSETWELSIRNGVVVAGKAVPDAS